VPFYDQFMFIKILHNVALAMAIALHLAQAHGIVVTLFHAFSILFLYIDMLQYMAVIRGTDNMVFSFMSITNPMRGGIYTFLVIFVFFSIPLAIGLAKWCHAINGTQSLNVLRDVLYQFVELRSIDIDSEVDDEEMVGYYVFFVIWLGVFLLFSFMMLEGVFVTVAGSQYESIVEQSKYYKLQFKADAMFTLQVEFPSMMKLVGKPAGETAFENHDPEDRLYTIKFPGSEGRGALASLYHKDCKNISNQTPLDDDANYEEAKQFAKTLNPKRTKMTFWLR